MSKDIDRPTITRNLLKLPSHIAELQQNLTEVRVSLALEKRAADELFDRATDARDHYARSLKLFEQLEQEWRDAIDTYAKENL